MPVHKYRVERFDSQLGWIKSSTHNNEEYAQVNADVLAQGGHPARVLRQGKIIYEAKNEAKH